MTEHRQIRFPDDEEARAVPLRRPWQGRMVAGVAAGVADYLDVDVSVVRIVLVVLTFFGGTGVLAYLAAWLLMPDEGAGTSMAEDWAWHLHTHGPAQRPPRGYGDDHFGAAS